MFCAKNLKKKISKLEMEVFHVLSSLFLVPFQRPVIATENYAIVSTCSWSHLRLFSRVLFFFSLFSHMYDTARLCNWWCDIHWMKKSDVFREVTTDTS